MRVILLTGIVLVAVLQATGVSQQTPNLPAIVAQFYPQSLDADLIKIDAQDVVVRNQCYAVLESDGQGTRRPCSQHMRMSTSGRSES